jgi:hypothetical protein
VGVGGCGMTYCSFHFGWQNEHHSLEKSEYRASQGSNGVVLNKKNFYPTKRQQQREKKERFIRFVVVVCLEKKTQE